MAAAQGWRWFLASFQDAVNVERGGGDVALGFSLAGLVSPQANLFRASGSEEPEVCILMAERKRIEAKEHEAEEVQPPWVTDGEPEMWQTLSDSGEPVAIPMIPLVTESHWRGTDGETSAQSPTKLLRVAGGIVDCRGTDDAMQFVGTGPRGNSVFPNAEFSRRVG